MRNLRQGVVQRGTKGGRGKRTTANPAAAPGQAAKGPAAPPGRVRGVSYAVQRALEAVRQRWMGVQGDHQGGVEVVEDSSDEEGA